MSRLGVTPAWTNGRGPWADGGSALAGEARRQRNEALGALTRARIALGEARWHRRDGNRLRADYELQRAADEFAWAHRCRREMKRAIFLRRTGIPWDAPGVPECIR